MNLYDKCPPCTHMGMSTICCLFTLCYCSLSVFHGISWHRFTVCVQTNLSNKSLAVAWIIKYKLEMFTTAFHAITHLLPNNIPFTIFCNVLARLISKYEILFYPDLKQKFLFLHFGYCWIMEEGDLFLPPWLNGAIAQLPWWQICIHSALFRPWPQPNKQLNNLFHFDFSFVHKADGFCDPESLPTGRQSRRWPLSGILCSSGFSDCWYACKVDVSRICSW